MKHFILILLFGSLSLALNAQFHQPEKIYPGVKIIKTKYYNGSGGRGWWSLRKLDDKGRVIEYQSRRRLNLIHTTQYKYNEHNDVTHQIEIQSINNPGRIDTSYYFYVYDENGAIIRQNESMFLETDDESVKILKTIYPKKNNYKRYVFDSENRVVSIVDTVDYTSFGETGLTIETTRYEYNKRGDISQRVITRNPEMKEKSIYVGAPGADDMKFRYRYNKAGRIKKAYVVIGLKRYKRYKNRYLF